LQKSSSSTCTTYPGRYASAKWVSGQSRSDLWTVPKDGCYGKLKSSLVQCLHR